MRDFDKAFELVVGEEGGYVNDPNDPGGETKYGVSKRAYPQVDIKSLTIDDAKAIYLRDYWTPAGCDKYPWPIDALVFDAAVNQGTPVAKMLLQKSLGVAQDGVMGMQTLDALAHADLRELARLFLADRALRYTGTRNFDKFGRGWFKRLFTLAMGVV